MLIIYDNTGKIFSATTGQGVPDGIYFLETEEQSNAYPVSVDTATNQVIWEAYPKSEMELLQERVTELENQNKALVEGINLATGVKESEV